MAGGIKDREQVENTKAITSLNKIIGQTAKVIARSPVSGAEKQMTLRWVEAPGAAQSTLQMPQSRSAKTDVTDTGEKSKTTKENPLKSLVSSGLFIKSADMVNSLTNAVVESKWGEETGTITSSLISGAGVGATIGAMIPAPPWSVVIGGVIGGAVGFFTGMAKNFERKDDAFKDYYKSQYESVTQEQGAALERGITLAGQKDSHYTELVQTETTLNQAKETYLGEGYVEERSKGLTAQNEWLEKQTSGPESENGTGMKSAYAMIGEFQAAQENKRESLEREALDAVMSGGELEQFKEGDGISRAGQRLVELRTQYIELVKSNDENAGAMMGALLAEAQVIANNEYNATDGAKAMQQSNLALAENIRYDSQLNDAYYGAGYALGQQFTKGLVQDVDGATFLQNAGIPSAPPPKDEYGHWEMNRSKSWVWVGGTQKPEFNGQYHSPTSHAYGLNRVPYDNFPALLHEGERVLTASQARQQDGGYGGVTVHINGPVNVREEADIQKVAAALAREVRRARILAVP